MGGGHLKFTAPLPEHNGIPAANTASEWGRSFYFQRLCHQQSFPLQTAPTQSISCGARTEQPLLYPLRTLPEAHPCGALGTERSSGRRRWPGLCSRPCTPGASRALLPGRGWRPEAGGFRHIRGGWVQPEGGGRGAPGGLNCASMWSQCGQQSCSAQRSCPHHAPDYFLTGTNTPCQGACTSWTTGGGTMGGGMAAPRLPCSSWAQPAPAFGASDGPPPRKPRTRGRTFGLFYEQVRDLRANQEAPRRRQLCAVLQREHPAPPFVLLESGTGATSTRRCPVPSQAGAAQSHPESHAHSIPHLKLESHRPVRLSS